MDERDLYRLQRECDLDRWYDSLKDMTMRTEFIPLSMDEGRIILDEWQLIAGSFNPAQVDKFLGQEPLQGLVGRMNNLLNTFSDGAFARLGTRSPKDSKLIEERGRKFFEQDQGPRAPPRDFNEDLIRKLRDQIAGLRIRTSRDLFTLFFTSERIRDDLEETIEHGDTQTIVLRAFEEIDPTTELRLFVKDRQIVAASQYNHLIVSDRLVHDGQRYLQATRDLQARVSDRLSLTSYILDVGFLHGNTAQPRLIEINPFCVGTSACLFSWKEDFAMGTKSPARFEFRVRTQPLQRRG